MKQLLAFFFCAVMAGTAAAQPTRPVEAVIGFGPGSGNEIVFRMVADQVERNTGAKFVVNTKPGAGGVVGTEYFLKLPADGHQLLVSSVGGTFALDRIAVPDRALGYGVDSFRYGVALASTPFVIVAHPQDPVETPRQLVEVLRREPTSFAASGGARIVYDSLIMAHKITEGTAGVERIEHKGPTFALNDVAGRHVRFAVTPILVAAPLIRDGKLKIIAHSGKGTIAQFPRAPSLESIMPGFSAPAVWGILLPRDTPDATVQWYAREFGRAVREPAVQALFEQNLLQAVPEALTSRGFEDYARQEAQVRQPVIERILTNLRKK